jgi:3',5'-cyclic AMP phosphodiesterase CpdA
LIIAHISDIHLGPQFVEEAYDEAVREIAKLKPDVVVATGDFTENGLVKEYRSAARRLSKLGDFPIVTVPGNHDYRFTGYLIYKELFGEKQTRTEGGTVFLAVSTARPDRDEGEVGHRQNLWLEESLRKFKDKTKVIVMHHHLVQVPDTGTDRITILDAGDILKSLFSAGADLVLCGHRHRPWMWRINDMLIVHAGTMSSERTRGFFANTYNIIELKESGGEAKIWLKIIGGKKIDMAQVIKEQKPYLPGLKSLV